MRSKNKLGNVVFLLIKNPKSLLYQKENSFYN